MNKERVSFRAIDGAVVSDRIIHRVERVPHWKPSAGPGWRSLCGTRVGEIRLDGLFEFVVPVAIDPEAWRLVANCPACLAATRKRELGTLT